MTKRENNLFVVDREENQARLEASLSCWGRSSARRSLPLPSGKSSQIGEGFPPVFDDWVYIVRDGALSSLARNEVS